MLDTYKGDHLYIVLYGSSLSESFPGAVTRIWIEGQSLRNLYPAGGPYRRGNWKIPFASLFFLNQLHLRLFQPAFNWRSPGNSSADTPERISTASI